MLVALAVPALSLNTATTGLDDISISEIEPLKKFDAAFPGGNDPAVVAIKADDVPPSRSATRSTSSSGRRSRPAR